MYLKDSEYHNPYTKELIRCKQCGEPLIVKGVMDPTFCGAFMYRDRPHYVDLECKNGHKDTDEYWSM